MRRPLPAIATTVGSCGDSRMAICGITAVQKCCSTVGCGSPAELQISSLPTDLDQKNGSPGAAVHLISPVTKCWTYGWSACGLTVSLRKGRNGFGE